MSKITGIDILQMCIDELNSTTKEQFNEKRKKLGIYDKLYNFEEYGNDEIEIIFDLDEVENEKKFEDINFSEDINFLQIQFDEEVVYYNNSKINMQASAVYNLDVDINTKSLSISALAA